jgi:predicted ester cyclase
VHLLDEVEQYDHMTDDNPDETGNPKKCHEAEGRTRASLAPNFVDNTLPAGRLQGLAGPLAASRLMRLAIPDLRCEIEQMIVAGDRVVTHLRFRGHFTGRFGQIQGQGQTINFIATDIYRLADGRIAENWHIEDNLTLQQELGLIPK